MRQIKSEIKQQTKASLFRKIIDFFIWGGLFLGFIALQHRYHRTLLVKVPINLITGEIGSKHNVYKPTPAFHTSPEKTTIITWNHFDSLVRMNQLNLSNRSVFNKSVDIFSIPLNNIDSVELVALPGIGTFTAKKIVQYRERLGGFISKMQLLEIPYLDSNLLCHPQLNWEVDTSSIKKYD